MDANDSLVKISPAYIAGLFDGEGCVSATIRPDKRLSFQVKITQKDRSILDLVANALGFGLVWFQGNHYDLRLFSADDISRFIEAVLPYCIVKRAQLVLMHELVQTISPSRRPLTPDVWMRRREIAAQIRALKG